MHAPRNCGVRILPRPTRNALESQVAKREAAAEVLAKTKASTNFGRQAVASRFAIHPIATISSF
jgi:hypothetical protein